jgi:hypothetical protein
MQKHPAPLILNGDYDVISRSERRTVTFAKLSEKGEMLELWRKFILLPLNITFLLVQN